MLIMLVVKAVILVGTFEYFALDLPYIFLNFASGDLQPTL